jgi:protein-S-isoprenylcysteine O-methyltransferase Ste14
MGERDTHRANTEARADAAARHARADTDPALLRYLAAAAYREAASEKEAAAADKEAVDEIPTTAPPSKGLTMRLKVLVGSGDKIGLFTLPFLVVGLVLNIAFPGVFEVGGPPAVLRVASIVALVIGVVIWAWSAALILANVSRGRLITTGPFSLVKHPLYTGVALLVLPATGFLLDTWLGAAVGLVMYVGSRIFAPAEESHMATLFGARWDRYASAVKLRWL